MPVLEHQPPERLRVAIRKPLVFLAGPIQGAPDWQTAAINIIAKEKCTSQPGTNLHIANPRREYFDDTFNYDKQVGWERAGIKRAAKNGAVIFWFAAQDKSLPYEAGREYAKTTRKEFLWVQGKMDENPFINVTVGKEPGYIETDRYFDYCLKETKLPVHETLAEVCFHALHLIAKE